MSTPEASTLLAVEGSLLPSFAAVYTEPADLAKVPWAAGAGMIATFGRSRPVSARYGEVSDIVRTTTSAMLARKITSQQGVSEIAAKLRPILQ